MTPTVQRTGRGHFLFRGRMENLLIAVISGLLVLLASVASVELGVSVALIEISLGVVAGNFLGLTSPPWMDFLASFGSILLTFLGVSVLVIWAMVALQPWFFSRYGERVIEPEIKGAVAALLVLMFFADKAQSHAVLPAFVLGLALARVFHEHPELTRRFRVVAFALLTPFFFLKGGMNVSLKLVWANLGLLVLLFAVKQVTKIAGVYPLARRWVPVDAMFVTLLMSTGLTFGTISSLYGFNAGLLDRAQFSVLVTVVVASAVIPTVIAQRWFHPEKVVLRPAPSSALSRE